VVLLGIVGLAVWLWDITAPLRVVIPIGLALLLARSVFRKPTFFIASGPRGIVMCDRRRRTVKLLEWKDVEEAHLARRKGVILLVCGEQVSCDAWGGNVREAERFVEHVKSHGAGK